MSILPSEIQGFASSPSSEPLSPNPNPNHGSDLSSPLSQSPTSPSGPVTGPTAPVAENSRRSSKKVSQFAAHNGRNFGSSQRRGKMSEATTASHAQHGHGPVHSHGSTAQSSGRKAQGVNGNHLLNFQYDPISRPQYRPSPPPRRSYKRKPYNKDLFLQANYKFVVLDSGNYTPESMDPDKMLQWEDIICMRYSTPHQVQCPICLEYPLCPQITSCGHIFCFPCILQYLYVGEDCDKVESFKRCPLCFVMISKKDLYNIYLENVKEYALGEPIEFMLLTRQKDSFAPTEKSVEGGTIAPQTSNQIGNPFSKFTFTTDVDLSVRRAVTDLDGWLARAESGLVDDLEKLPYVAAALEELEKRKKNWNQHAIFRKNRSHKCASYQSDSQSSPARSVRNTENVMGKLRSGMVPTDGSEQSSSSPQIGQENSLAVDSVVQTPNASSQSSESKDQDLMSTNEITDLGRHLTGSLDMKESDSYNYYQVVDGQNIILHPLNMKILLHHYGNHEMLPHRIRGRILQLETVSQSESTRRRLRFLSHFSLTTTFQFCEIDLSEALPSDALLPFMDEIKKREKQRKQVARKEQRDKNRADAVNQIPIAIQYNVGQSSNFNFPTYSMDEFQALEGTSVMSTSPPVVGERQTFSNVTRLGFAAAHDSPSLKTEEDSSPLKSQAKTDSPNGSTSTPSFANMISRAKPVEGGLGSKKSEVGKKGKRPMQILLSTSRGRRY